MVKKKQKRKPPEGTKAILVYIPIELEKFVRTVAERERRNRSAQIIWVLQRWAEQEAA